MLGILSPSWMRYNDNRCNNYFKGSERVQPLRSEDRRKVSPFNELVLGASGFEPETSCASYFGLRQPLRKRAVSDSVWISTLPIRRPGPTVAAKWRGGKTRVVGEVGISWIAVKRVSHRYRARHGARPHGNTVAAFALGASPVPLVVGSGHCEFLELAAVADAQSLANIIESHHKF